MRPSPHPIRSARAAGACAAGACAALLLAAAGCAPESGVVAPEPFDAAALEATPVSPAQCEELRLPRAAVREMTGVDPLCVAPHEQPTIWREHFARGVPSACGCADILGP